MSQCPTTKKHLFFFVAAVGILSAGAGHASPAITVSANGNSIGRYNVYELTLTGPSASYNNPWDNVKISAVFTGPSGKSTVGGFYYNVNTWKVRFAPEGHRQLDMELDVYRSQRHVLDQRLVQGDQFFQQRIFAT